MGIYGSIVSHSANDEQETLPLREIQANTLPRAVKVRNIESRPPPNSIHDVVHLCEVIRVNGAKLWQLSHVHAAQAHCVGVHY